MSKELSRRGFLKETAFGALALTAARWVPASTTSLLPGETARQLEYFSAHEYVVVEAVAERIVGSPDSNGVDASHIGVAMRADKFLATADPEIQEQFHELLTVFNAPLFTFLFDFRFSSFLNMTPEDKDSYLEDWMTSVLGFRRQGFQALKRICMSMFYTDSRTWAETGFDGVFFPSEA
ncbi:MAG: gluconate 2-dehydrogenase subunit 3 family protein [Bacteroidota bacterium]